MKNGRPATQGVCPACGTKMFRIGQNESTAAAEQPLEVERIKNRFGALDQRLDNIDSMVMAAAERVMNQPITLSLTCPNCSKNIEVTIIGREKPTV